VELRTLDSLAQAGVAAIEAEATSPATRILVIVAEPQTNIGHCSPFTMAGSKGLGARETTAILQHALSHLQGRK